MTHSAPRLFPGALLLLALLSRLGYFWEHRKSPFFDAPVVDAKSFLQQAQIIAGGELWGGTEPFWQPPLYIYLLGFVCWLFPISYFVAIRLVQAGLGALSCLLVYTLARRAFDEKVARIAGGIAAVCGSFFYFEGELLAVTVEIFLNLLLLHRLLVAQARSRDRDWILAGLIASLAALARPNILLFIAVFAAWLCWQRQDSVASLRRAIPSFLLPAALVILLVTWRNWSTEPDIVLISSNGGVNFYIGNNADYKRTVAIRPGKQWNELVMEPRQAGHKTAAAKSGYFLRKSLSYIANYPLDYLFLLYEKGCAFWHGHETKRNQDIYYARQHSLILSALLWDRVLAFPFGLLGPLSLLGLALSLKFRAPPFLLLRLYTLSYVASVVLFFPTARYRMPVLPVLIIFAAFAIWRLHQSGRHKSWVVTIGQVVPLTALLVLCNRSTSIGEDPQLYFDLGEVHLRKGDYTLAERYSRQALQLDPSYNYARHNLAVSYFHQGRYDASEREALATIAEYPLRPDTHVLLGRIYLDTQKPRPAASHLRQALAIDSASGMGHYYMGRLLYNQEHYEEAATHLQRALPLLPKDFWLPYEIGRALQQAGKIDAALSYYQQALALARRPEALVAIGAMHLLSDRAGKAQAHLLQALALDPDNQEAHINLAVLDLESGDLVGAIERLQQVLARGASPKAQRLLDEVRRQVIGER